MILNIVPFMTVAEDCRLRKGEGVECKLLHRGLNATQCLPTQRCTADPSLVFRLSLARQPKVIKFVNYVIVDVVVAGGA